ncbi:MAG: hypothetical protein M3410_12270 [Acidobacteriota bacterium]|nr:hypothetical protein [Acidobacteriota bacterium]
MVTKKAVKANKPNVIGIKVRFELIAKDKLRRVVFGLEKDSEGNAVAWKIDFQLFERDKKGDPWDEAIVILQVEVEKALNAKAEKALKGLTPGQSAHALGPAADDAKAARDGEIDEDEARETVGNTLRQK